MAASSYRTSLTKKQQLPRTARRAYEPGPLPLALLERSCRRCGADCQCNEEELDAGGPAGPMA